MREKSDNSIKPSENLVAKVLKAPFMAVIHMKATQLGGIAWRGQERYVDTILNLI